MEFSASQIAAVIEGKIEGNPDVKISQLSKIEEGEPGTLSFLANPKYTQYIYTTKASIVIVNKDFTPDQPVSPTLIRVDDAYTAFARLLELYNNIKNEKSGVSSLAFVAKSAVIGSNVYIGEFAYIGDNTTVGDNTRIFPHVFLGDNVKIGHDCTLYAGVIIYSENKIGNECTIHGGVVIGADGFGFAPQQDKNYKKVAQIGNVVIEDNVEIGSNTTIDRATLGSTIIRRGAKLDNLIQIAHNVEIGENTVIAAQTGISGSTKIGRNCMIAGQVGFVGHLSIGDDVKIGAQSGVSGNLKDGSIFMGSPAIDISIHRRALVHFKNLPEIVKRLDQLESRLNRE
ncbi:MAG: UDP-3-O-(3-hydroxymyristoyl)glucosamine N-acyltransferase [Bacteroidales bacterium]|jgi:UDP-3-O-[3-hydroxymyristoyl] glucosamine N-acyltransferase|nr:UDP-3-O-(3-hydroxymyristoyl)glucosamine N-acyltransferase [Bacteroidales bacterium]